jgi:hypothetical protein
MALKSEPKCSQMRQEKRYRDHRRRENLMRQMRNALAAGGVAAVALVAYANPAASSTCKPSQVRSATLACFRHHGPDESNAQGYVGFSVSKASQMARSVGDEHRTVAKNGACSTIAADLTNRRVNLWVFHGKVIEARIF